VAETTNPATVAAFAKELGQSFLLVSAFHHNTFQAVTTSWLDKFSSGWRLKVIILFPPTQRTRAHRLSQASSWNSRRRWTTSGSRKPARPREVNPKRKASSPSSERTCRNQNTPSTALRSPPPSIQTISIPIIASRTACLIYLRRFAAPGLFACFWNIRAHSGRSFQKANLKSRPTANTASLPAVTTLPQESQTQEDTQPMDEPAPPPLHAKRPLSNDGARPKKKIKISMAPAVDLAE
jgi:hypothetical protein